MMSVTSSNRDSHDTNENENSSLQTYSVSSLDQKHHIISNTKKSLEYSPDPTESHQDINSDTPQDNVLSLYSSLDSEKTTASHVTLHDNSSSNAVVAVMARGCTTAALVATQCIGEAHKKASDLLNTTLTSAVGYLSKPLISSINVTERTPLNMDRLISQGTPVIILLGKEYTIDKETDREEFWEDFCSHVIFTYRKGFHPIPEIQYTENNLANYSLYLETRVTTLQSAKSESNKSQTNAIVPDTLKTILQQQKESILVEQCEEFNQPCCVTTLRQSELNISEVVEHDVPDRNTHNFVGPSLLSPDLIEATNTFASSNILPLIRRSLCEDKNGNIISDAGWGCMIRATQMGVCQSLITLRLGRGWRRRYRGLKKNTISVPLEHNASGLAMNLSSNMIEDRPVKTHPDNHGILYKKPIISSIISIFADHIYAPLSIHNISCYGATFLGISIGTWLGPTSCALAISGLMQSPRFKHCFLDLVPVVFPDGLIIHSQVRHIWEQSKHLKTALGIEIKRSNNQDDQHDIELEENHTYNGSVAALVIICMRLGTNCFNVDKYKKSLSKCFSLPQFQGLAGGGSFTSAHFFLGDSPDGLLFFDPHTEILPAFIPDLVEFLPQNEDSLSSTGTAVQIKKDEDDEVLDKLFISNIEENELQFFSRGPGASVVPWKNLNPSMALYFLCKSPEEYNHLVLGLGVASEDAPELFEMIDTPMDFSSHPDRCMCSSIEEFADGSEFHIYEKSSVHPAASLE